MKSSAGRILVVDDEKSIREGLSKVLRAEDYEVMVAEAGNDAMERYGTGRIDLLLLDLNLPGGNDWATVEWLAKVNPLLPVVVITGRANQRELAEKFGADALMEKPLDVPLLLQTIRELLDEPMETRAQRASRREEFFREMLAERLRFPTPFPSVPGRPRVENRTTQSLEHRPTEPMKKRIMVLDDDEPIRQSLLKLLQTEDYEVVLASEGTEALDELERHSVHLLLLDLNLPDRSGWDVFERITSTNPLLPIIIITGKQTQSELAIAAGVGALMQKPLDVPLLLKTISELLLETPEKRLKRLVGIEQSTRCFQPASAAASVPKPFRGGRNGTTMPRHL